MFTQAEYTLLAKRCPADLEAFLAALALSLPASWDDRAAVEQVDAEAVRRICEKLRSKSLLDGCYTLLEAAGESYDFSETTRVLLERIGAHQGAIRAGMTAPCPVPAAEDASLPTREVQPAAQVGSASPRGQSLSFRYLGTGILAADLAYLLLAAKSSPAVVILLAVAGVYMMARGGRTDNRSAAHLPQPMHRQAAPPPRRVFPRFTEAEADDALRTLDVLRRLYQAL